jgi:hypothetical protein
MGFISGAFNKSVFDKSSYKAAIGDTNAADGNNGYAAIRLQPDYPRSNGEEDPPIVGIIQKDGLSFSIEANWQELGGIGAAIFPKTAAFVQGAYDKINNVSMVMGNADWMAVAASRKIYQKSGYLKINPSIRIVDWKGVGQPIMSSLLLTYYATPSYNEVATVAEVLSEFKNALTFAGMSDKTMEGIVTKSMDVAKSSTEMIGSFDKSFAGGRLADQAASTKNQLAGLDKDISLRSSPVPLTVAIGNFFKRKDMIVENITFDFSREMTASGPLYVDIALSLSSRKIISSFDDIGINIPGKKSRVFSSWGGSNSTGI